MRRLLLVVCLGLVLAPVAACADDSEPAAGSSTPATTPAATTGPSAANAEQLCTEFEALFDESNFQVLGAAIGELIVYRQSGMTDQATQAEEKIKTQISEMATTVTGLSERAVDPELKSGFAEVATKIQSATDLAFLDGVTSVEQIQGPLTTMLLDWVAPVNQACGIS